MHRKAIQSLTVAILALAIMALNASAQTFQNRPLLEEYTGLRCKYCPEGYVTLAQMQDEYGDNLVTLVYHCSSFETGCMVTLNDDELPVEAEWFPSGTINRHELLNPYQFRDAWLVASAQQVDVAVETTLAYIDETHVQTTACVTFSQDLAESPYLISIALAASNLHNNTWLQKNDFSDDTTLTGPYWDLFVGKGDPVAGLVFNDVVAYYKDVHGIEGSLPSQIEAGKQYETEIVIDMDEVINTRNKSFINADATLHAVAMVVDSHSGLTVNCNKSAKIAYGSYMGITDCDAEQVVDEFYLSVSGLRSYKPFHGLNIKVCVLSDGTINTSKHLYN